MLYVFHSIKSHLKSGLFRTMLAMCFFAVVVGWLAAGFSGRQPATVMLDFSFSLLRVCLVVSFAMFLWDSLGRIIESKSINSVLANPISRTKFLFDVYISSFLTTLVLALISMSILWLVAGFGFSYEQGTPVNLGAAYLVFWLVLTLELALVGCFVLFLYSFSETVILPVLLSIVFYIAGHLIGPSLEYLAGLGALDENSLNHDILEVIIYLLPDLNLLDQRHAVLYGLSLDLNQLIVTFLKFTSYGAALFLVADRIFYRRDLH